MNVVTCTIDGLCGLTMARNAGVAKSAHLSPGNSITSWKVHLHLSYAQIICMLSTFTHERRHLMELCHALSWEEVVLLRIAWRVS